VIVFKSQTYFKEELTPEKKNDRMCCLKPGCPRILEEIKFKSPTLFTEELRCFNARIEEQKNALLPIAQKLFYSINFLKIFIRNRFSYIT